MMVGALFGAPSSRATAKAFVLVACLAAQLARAQRPTWNDVTFDPSVDRRNNWCDQSARGTSLLPP
jgi:hypothetical protein